MTFYITSMIIFGICLLISIIIAIKRWKVLWNSKERIIVILLLTTLIFEIIANLKLWIYWKSPARITDTLNVISILLVIYWFYQYLKNKWFAIASAIVVIAVLILDLEIISDLDKQLPFNSVARAVIIIISVFMLMRSFLNTNIEINLKVIRSFWISSGMLVYYSTIMALILFLPKLTRMDWELNLVISFVNVVFYLSIAYALSLDDSYE